MGIVQIVFYKELSSSPSIVNVFHLVLSHLVFRVSNCIAYMLDNLPYECLTSNSISPGIKRVRSRVLSKK